MATIDAQMLLTTRELLAMPDDGVDRELSRGRLREQQMTRREPKHKHTRTGANIVFILVEWLKQQPLPRDQVMVGDAGFQLHHDPDTTVGTDVAYISADLAKSINDDTCIIDGIPVLAVEILSPSDKQEDGWDKVRDYLDAGVPIVWLVEPVFKTITVFRPGVRPQMFSEDDEWTAEPHLPGLKTAVAQIFE